MALQLDTPLVALYKIRRILKTNFDQCHFPALAAERLPVRRFAWHRLIIQRKQ
jgi:hypothetical protein